MNEILVKKVFWVGGWGRGGGKGFRNTVYFPPVVGGYPR